MEAMSKRRYYALYACWVIAGTLRYAVQLALQFAIIVMVFLMVFTLILKHWIDPVIAKVFLQLVADLHPNIWHGLKWSSEHGDRSALIILAVGALGFILLMFEECMESSMKREGFNA